MKIKALGFIMLGMCITSCDDSTNTLGIYTDSDNINASYSIYNAYTKSVWADSVLSNSNTCYLGYVTDPETGVQIKGEFLAQFGTPENYEFPDYDLLVKDEQGQIQADSIEIRLYYNDYYGDDKNPMKLEVYELDTTHVIREDSIYYSNLDLASFVNPRAEGPIARKMFTVKDLTQSDETLSSSSYSPHVRILLPKEYGTFIMRKYFENKDFFKNSYQFIRHVCPGFYFKLADGNGTMVHMSVSALNVYFSYKDVQKDTIYAGISRFAATPEVLQHTSFQNQDLKPLIEETDWTYLKTPAGIFTELTLPIDEIYKGHEQDSISQAQLSLYRYNSTLLPEQESLGIPENLLMVRKQDMYKFFEEQKTTDGKTAYVTSFNSSYNTYTFSNIGNLVAYCRQEKNANAAQANQTPDAWAQAHPEWNKVVLIPVKVTQDDNKNIISITHDMGLNSIRLVGGEEDPIKMQVIYSKFN